MAGEFVAMPAHDGMRFNCTHAGCGKPAKSGCRNCGAARCEEHPSEPHEYPCVPRPAAAPRCEAHDAALANEAFFRCGCRYIHPAP